MTNEELAQLIQSGRREYEAQLWAQVERLISVQARGYAYRYSLAGCAADEEDLKQAGYFAMLEAVRYYQPEKEYKYITYLKWTLKRSFAEVAGIKTSKRDAAQFANSLDAPMANDEDNSSGIAFIIDENAQETFKRIEEDDYTLYVRAALLEAMRPLSDRKQEILALVYWGGLTFTEISDFQKRTSPQAVEQAHYEALHWLRVRRGHALQELLWGFDAQMDSAMGSGFQRFRDRGESSTERAAFTLMEWRRWNERR